MMFLKKKGLFSYHNGQNTYNGVAIISNKELIDVQFDIPNFHDEQKRLISGIYPNDDGLSFVLYLLTSQMDNHLTQINLNIK